jgi:hypothetical protein
MWKEMSSLKFKPIKNEIKSASRLAKPENLQFPLEDNNYGVLLVFKEYEYVPFDRRTVGWPTPENARSGDTIFLPLPANIIDNNTVRVNRFEQGLTSILSGVLSDISRSGGMNLSDFQAAAIEAARIALPEGFTSGAEFANVLGDLVNTVIGRQGTNTSLDRFSSEMAFLIRRNLPGDIGRSVDAGTGTYINPKAALTFEGVEMKRHSMDWMLSPKSPAESIVMQKIIQTIKKKILPTYITGEISNRTMFRYPSLVDIFLVGLDQEYYFYYKSSMIENFSIDYSPSGMSVLKGGKPSSARLQIQFTETDIHTAEDYGAESYVFSESDTNLLSENPPTNSLTNAPIGSTV